MQFQKICNVFTPWEVVRRAKNGRWAQKPQISKEGKKLM